MSFQKIELFFSLGWTRGVNAFGKRSKSRYFCYKVKNISRCFLPATVELINRKEQNQHEQKVRQVVGETVSITTHWHLYDENLRMRTYRRKGGKKERYINFFPLLVAPKLAIEYRSTRRVCSGLVNISYKLSHRIRPNDSGTEWVTSSCFSNHESFPETFHLNV